MIAKLEVHRPMQRPLRARLIVLCLLVLSLTGHAAAKLPSPPSKAPTMSSAAVKTSAEAFAQCWERGLIDSDLVMGPPYRDVKPTVQRLLTLSGYKQAFHEFDAIVEFTQKAWLRPKGSERWQLAGDLLPKGVTTEVEELFDGLHMYRDIAPRNLNYRYALLAGATAASMRERFAYLVELWKLNKVRFSELVFLVSERPLDLTYETPEAILGRYTHKLPIRPDWQASAVLPKTEAESARLLYEQAALPKELAAVPVHFISAPMQKDAQGVLRRATTDDTFVAWLAQHPDPGSVVMVSQNPFCGYQHAVACSLLSGSFSVETIGPGKGWAQREFSMPIMFDSLGRLLFQLRKGRLLPAVK